MYQCRYNCNKRATLVGDVSMGEAMHVCGQRVYIWEISVPYAQFCYGPKTAQNTKSTKKIFNSANDFLSLSDKICTCSQ